MALRNSRPTKWRPKGLSDAQDGSNAFSGAMMLLKDLIPSPTTGLCWVPRPASLALTTFPGFTSPAQINALLQVGNIVYGMIAETSGTYSGKDVPFAYNVASNTFETIAIPQGAAALPTTPATSGDWTPPIMAAVGSKILITHPGYAGASTGFYFGWLDISGFTSTSLTGTTHSNKVVDSISSDALTAGWQVGMTITDSNGDIPANTVITSINSGGTAITISNNATGSNAGGTLTVSGGTSTAPVYAAGNTNGNALIAVPVSVAQFNARAYYAVQNGVVLSDAGNALQVTNATQVLTFSNGLNATALGGLPYQQTTGGLLQALIAFQGDTTLQQITGDPVTMDLAVNQIGVGVGTLAPLTICNTLLGLTWIAPDGMRIMTFSGIISEPIGANGDGVCYPFLSAIAPSRMAAAFNQNIFRASVQNGAAVGEPTQEYWYDFKLQVWSGPHSFPAAHIVAYQGSPDHGFTVVPSSVTAALFSSAVTPSVNDTYVENGTQMTWDYQSVLLPDTDGMTENNMVETTLSCAIPRNQNWTVIALDELNAVLAQLQLAGPTISDTIWGSFTWGPGSLWGGASVAFEQQPVNWDQAIVFKQMSLQVSGISALGTIIGNFNLLIQQLGYLTQAPYGLPVPPVTAVQILTSDSGIILTDDSGIVLTTDSV